jgi:hypothetical protein
LLVHHFGIAQLTKPIKYHSFPKSYARRTLWITGKEWIVPICFTSCARTSRILVSAFELDAQAPLSPGRRARDRGETMTEVKKNRKPQEAVSAETTQKLKRRQKRERGHSARKDSLMLDLQVHQVTIQGMQVSLPWLRFMAPRDG